MRPRPPFFPLRTDAPAGAGVGVHPIWLPTSAGGSRFLAHRLAFGGVVSPLSLPIFAAGLVPGGVAWSPWPHRPGVLLVTCRSRLAAEHCCRRARLFRLAVAGPLRVSSSCWLVAVRWVAHPPSTLSVRLGVGSAALSAQQSLPGVSPPVPLRGGSSHSPSSFSRSVPAVSLRQGRLF